MRRKKSLLRRYKRTLTIIGILMCELLLLVAAVVKISFGSSEWQEEQYTNGADNILDVNGIFWQEYEEPYTGYREEYMLEVPYINQNPGFPTGCESVSAVMVLRYHEIYIGVEDFIDNYLVMDEYYYDENGVMYGAHPAQAFIGNPRENTGFGCYAPVIYNAMERLLSDKKVKLTATLTTGSALDELCREYIDNDIPVLVWASMDMKPTREGRSWILENGEEFTWIAGEHCLVLVGYDNEFYYFNDPLVGEKVAYEREIVELRYRELGSQSLVIE